MKLAEIGIKTLQIEISTFCNIRCSFCPIDKRSASPSEFMPLEKVHRILDQCAQDGSLEVVGFQFLNEPLLHPQIREILAYAHERNLRTYCCTNGTILNPRIIDMLAKASPSRLKVSVQDVNPTTFNRVKGTKMRFDDFKSRVAALIDRRIHDPSFTTRIEIDIAVPAHRQSFAEKVYGLSLSDKTINDADDTMLHCLREFLTSLESRVPDMTIDWDKFNPDLRHTKTWRADFTPTAVLAPGITLELKGFYDWLGIEARRPVTYGACPRLEQLVVNYHGNLQLCCVDTHGRTSIGNVFTQPLSEIVGARDNLAKLLRASGYELPTEHCRTCVGAETQRGTVFLNFVNRFKYGYPKFVPEAERDAVASLQRLREDEAVQGNRPVVAAIDESLGARA